MGAADTYHQLALAFDSNSAAMAQVYKRTKTFNGTTPVFNTDHADTEADLLLSTDLISGIIFI